jgi:predicted metal-dependent hydrolase
MKSTTPPSYTIRRSPKAKNLRLKVTREEGLCVVIPRGYDEKKIPGLLKQKKVWIADSLKRIGETRRFLEPVPANHLPNLINLKALGEAWPVTYRSAENYQSLRLAVEGREVVISGTEFKRADVLQKIRSWLRVKTKTDLFPLAERIAAKHRFRLKGLMVKSQRTRWASCSAKKNLALNTKLLFLPPELVHYVLIHELCHIIHMNHSKEFWRLVAASEPRYKVLDQALRQAWKSVPPWVFER